MPRLEPTVASVHYVLCKRAGRAALFACGSDPRRSTFDTESRHAQRFPSVNAALAYRAELSRADAEGSAVFQLLPDGVIVPPET